MPRPDVLLLEADEFGHAMLYRYTQSGEFAGDSWYESVEAAKSSASQEYGEARVGPWEPVPDGEPDGHDFAIRQASRKEAPSG